MPFDRKPAKLEQVGSGLFVSKHPVVVSIKVQLPPIFPVLPVFGLLRMFVCGIATCLVKLILPRISGRVKSSDILSRRRKRVMQKVQKTYTTEFKREAVHLAQTSGKPITQIARELGISDTSIHQWRKELTEHGPEAFPGSGHQTAQEEELRRLKRELERTQKERDILKKPSYRISPLMS